MGKKQHALLNMRDVLIEAMENEKRIVDETIARFTDELKRLTRVGLSARSPGQFDKFGEPVPTVLPEPNPDAPTLPTQEMFDSLFGEEGRPFPELIFDPQAVHLSTFVTNLIHFQLPICLGR